jgi:Zn-dependent protease
MRMLASNFSYGIEVALCLLLLLIFSLRFKVRPHASMLINVPVAKVWALLAPYDGKIDQWGNMQIVTTLISAESKSYAIQYSTTQSNGTVRKFFARFTLAEVEDNRLLVMKREGLEGKSSNNELLEIRHEFEAVGEVTKLRTTYVWGPRPFLAQLLARTDLWGGIYRIKGLAETGQPNNKPYWIINGLVALVTALMSVAAFGLVTSWVFGFVLVFALLVHEFGHLLAFRLIGQPWGRVVFLPFLGAVAVPRLPYETQAESVFAALMGPGFSVLLAAGCALPTFFGWRTAGIYVAVGVLTAFLNAFNMLPAEPLDGGVALRSILTRLVGKSAWSALLSIGLLMVAIGFAVGQLAVAIFGAIAVLANLRRRTIDTGLLPLTSLQMCIAFFGYVAITGAHITMMNWFMRQLGV